MQEQEAPAPEAAPDNETPASQDQGVQPGAPETQEAPLSPLAAVEDQDQTDTGARAEIPRWRCHKVVEAFKIASVAPKAGVPGAMLVPEDERLEPVEVSIAYVEKHRPMAGGYFVRYEGGYQSWSPAEAFEAGYTRL